MLIMGNRKARKGKTHESCPALSCPALPIANMRVPFILCPFSGARAWGFYAYVPISCHEAAKHTTLFWKKQNRFGQATRHPAQPDASVRQVSVSISVAVPAPVPTPWLRLWLCSPASVCGVLSVSVAFQAHLMRIMSTTTTMSQSRQARESGNQRINSQLS